MKKLLTLALALVAIVVQSGSVAPGFPERATSGQGQNYYCLTCKRLAIPARPVDRCHGDWQPLDNTNNWKYQAGPGPDHFSRKNGNSGARSCTKCRNGGTIQQDFNGQEDWCVRPGQAAATAPPSCPSGFTWLCESCKRPAIPERAVDRCHGDWHLLDNTNNWKYQAGPGSDHFSRSNGKPGARSCTKCPNGGTIRKDFNGQEDWCVKPGQVAVGAPGKCPAGFSLG